MNDVPTTQTNAAIPRRTFLITVPGVARGKQRARVVMRGRFPTAYTPKETVSAENWVRHCCIEQVGQPCLEGPLLLTMDIIVAIPQSWSRKKQEAALNSVIFPTGKPDLDNTIKLHLDSLNGCLFRDDSQIVSLSVTKRYGRAPCTTLRVTTL